MSTCEEIWGFLRVFRSRDCLPRESLQMVKPYTGNYVSPLSLIRILYRRAGGSDLYHVQKASDPRSS